MLRKFILIFFTAILLFVIIQFIPYGRDHTNPPVVKEPNWDNQQTRQMAQTACFDCHSNETVWPVYASIAPGSWLIYRDVIEGRQRLNFSAWNQNALEEPGELAAIVLEGEMPPIQYLLLHPLARLSTTQKDQLATGLQATINR